MSEKPHNHTCKNTLARTHKVNDNVRVNNVFSFFENNHCEGDKITFERAIYDKQNLTRVVIPKARFFIFI